MRTSKDPLEFLKVVAKKKPQLQELLDKADTMKPEEIDALSQPLWIREALKKVRESDDRQMYVMARLARVIAAEEEAAKMPVATYEVRLWDGSSTFLGGSGAKGGLGDWKIEVNSGDSFLIIDDEFVRFGDSVLKLSDFERYPLMQCSKFVGYMTLSNYRGFHRALLNQKHQQ